MNQVTPIANGVRAKPLRQVSNVRELLSNEAAQNQLRAVAASHLRPERVMKLLATAIRTTPKLADCEPMSLLGAMMTSASLGLECNTPMGHAFLVPFKNGQKSKAATREAGREVNVYDVTLIIGYRGMIDLARRSGHVVNLYADVVCKGDEFSYEYGSNQHLRHKPGHKRGDPIYAYAHAKLTDGEAFIVLPWEEIEKTRDTSHGYRTAVQYRRTDNPWQTNLFAMAAKTAIRRLFKFLPVSIEMARAAHVDERAANYADIALEAPTEPDFDVEIERDETPGDTPDHATKPAAKRADKADPAETIDAETGEVTEAPSAPAVSEKDAKWAIGFTGLVRTDLESITDENGLDEFEADHAGSIARLGAIDADARAALEAEIAAKREALS